MTDQDRRRRGFLDRSDPATASALPKTADESRGASNLATTPFAGNISTDTRAGRAGCRAALIVAADCSRASSAHTAWYSKGFTAVRPARTSASMSRTSSSSPAHWQATRRA